MTWGEIRAELTERYPGFSLDLIDSFIRNAYDEILDSREWSRLNAKSTLQTIAKYSTGTVSLTQVSNTVIGSGTTFTSQMSGRRFRVAGFDVLYTFTYVSGTSGTLDRTYEGETESGLAYDIFPDVYQLGNDVKYAHHILNPRLNRPIEQKTQREIDNLAITGGPWFGEPYCWAPDADTAEDNPPIYQRVRFWPIPDKVMSFPYTYQVAPIYFDGTNTSSAPLPWVSAAAITASAAARILRHMKDYAGAGAEQTEGDRLEGRMNRVENESREVPRMKMADRFTRHRRSRYCR